MSGDEFRTRLAELEAKANLAYACAVARRTANGGRYWALGAVVAALACERIRAECDQWLSDQVEALEESFYAERVNECAS